MTALSWLRTRADHADLVWASGLTRRAMYARMLDAEEELDRVGHDLAAEVAELRKARAADGEELAALRDRAVVDALELDRLRAEVARRPRPRWDEMEGVIRLHRLMREVLRPLASPALIAREDQALATWRTEASDLGLDLDDEATVWAMFVGAQFVWSMGALHGGGCECVSDAVRWVRAGLLQFVPEVGW